MQVKGVPPSLRNSVTLNVYMIEATPNLRSSFHKGEYSKSYYSSDNSVNSLV